MAGALLGALLAGCPGQECDPSGGGGGCTTGYLCSAAGACVFNRNADSGTRPGGGNRDGGEYEPYCDPYYQVCLTGRSAPGASTR